MSESQQSYPVELEVPRGHAKPQPAPAWLRVENEVRAGNEQRVQAHQIRLAKIAAILTLLVTAGCGPIAVGVGGVALGLDGDSSRHYPPPAQPPATPPPVVNTPPTAAFSINHTSGTKRTLFAVDASACADAEDPSPKLEVRWDWEDDGVWDTAFSALKTTGHTYSKHGAKRVRLEVRDSRGLTASAVRNVNVGHSAQDLNGDGYADLVVGTPDYEGTGPGRVFVFYGGPGRTSADLSGAGQADAVFTGEASGDAFGKSVATGDVNGDGLADLVVGAPINGRGGISAGRVYVFFGKSPSLAGVDMSSGGTADVVFTAPQINDVLGVSVTTGDLNADGVADVIGGANFDVNSGVVTQGRVFVFFGGVGLSNQDLSAGGSADLVFRGESYIDRFGKSVSAGDVNGDGVEDLIVGADQAKGAGTDSGRVYVFYGGFGIVGVDMNAGGSADVVFTGQATYDQFGFSTFVADVSGDGIDDILAGAYLNDAGGNAAGRAYVFYGGHALASVDLSAGQVASVTVTGEAAGQSFGNLVYAEDVNGDGTEDLIASSHGFSSSRGRVYVFHGGPSLGDVDLSSGGTADLAMSGEAAGDVFKYPGGLDLDADGTPDLVVGAIFNDAGGLNAGRTYVFLGRPTLVSVDLSSGIADLVFTGPSGTTRFGMDFGN